MQSTHRAKGTLTISQANYTMSMLEKYGMGNCNQLSTPGKGPELSLEHPEEKLLDAAEEQRYQVITGSLMHLAQVIRYDVLYTTWLRGWRSHQKLMWLRRSICFDTSARPRTSTITYKRSGFKVTAFSDANWG